MRIIAGKYKGLQLKTPCDRSIRPTTDRVREAIFSSLYTKVENATILDAFTGSGALSIEAISRGAKLVIACDINTKLAKANTYNIENIKLRQTDIFKAKFNNKFDIVFLDPPYDTNPEDIMYLINKLKANSNIDSDTIIVYEHDKEHTFSNVVKTKKYGNTIIDYLGVQS